MLTTSWKEEFFFNERLALHSKSYNFVNVEVVKHPVCVRGYILVYFNFRTLEPKLLISASCTAEPVEATLIKLKKV